MTNNTLAITHNKILPKYRVTLQNVEFRQCKIKYGYLWKITLTFVKNESFAAIESKCQSRIKCLVFGENLYFSQILKRKKLKADFFSENGLL